MDDKIIHTLQLGMVLATAILLIIFAHQYIDPLAVFTSMIAGIGGIVGTRIASNGYVKPSTPTTVTPPAPTTVVSVQQQPPTPVQTIINEG